MHRRSLTTLLMCLPALAMTTLAAQAQGSTLTAEQTTGLKPAKLAWLALMDAGDHSGTWSSAASAFKGALTAAQWRQAVQGARTPMGAVQHRREKATSFTRSLPGAPEGQYAVVQFDTDFINKTKVVETLTLVLEADGVWRVTGYFVR